MQDPRTTLALTAAVALAVVVACLVSSATGRFALPRRLHAPRLGRRFDGAQGRLDLRSLHAVQRRDAIVLAGLDLVVFVLAASFFVQLTQGPANEKIGGFVDALCFTVGVVTMTGTGDVVLEGTGGRLLAIGILAAGIPLSLRLGHVCLRFDKVRFPCPWCGHGRHDADAVRCKACGQALDAPSRHGRRG